MASRNRATSHEYQERVDVLQALWARGFPPSRAIQLACQQWGISERQAKRYLQAAREQVEEQIKKPLEHHYAQVWLELGYIFQKAVQDGDLKLAQRVTGDRMRLLKQLRAELPLLETSGRLSPEELEEMMLALADEERKYPREDDLEE